MKALLFLLATSAWAIEPGFEAIFDGKTLDGWKHDGNWAVVNGEIARVKKGDPMPHGVPMKLLSNDQKWTDAPELGVLGHVFEQDMDNLPYVQDGLHASKTGEVNLGDYQEIRIRQFHQTLDKYLNA